MLLLVLHHARGDRRDRRDLTDTEGRKRKRAHFFCPSLTCGWVQELIATRRQGLQEQPIIGREYSVLDEGDLSLQLQASGL